MGFFFCLGLKHFLIMSYTFLRVFVQISFFLFKSTNSPQISSINVIKSLALRNLVISRDNQALATES